MNISKKLVTTAALLLVSLSGTQVLAQVVADTDSSDVNVSFAVEATPLRINSVSHFVFGNHPVTATQETVIADATLNLSLTDNRGFQTSDGWTLSAALSGFTSAETTTASLAGAYITLDSSIASGSTTLVAPQLTNPVKLQSNGSINTVAFANRTAGGVSDGEGVGTWAIDWNTMDNITLTTLENTVSPGDHAAEVTWTLTDALQ